jgi:hypothetical protein
MTHEEQPDVIITDDASYGAEKDTLVPWEEIAADVLAKLKAEHPALANVTLDEFIKACPYKMKIVSMGEEVTP